jgi:hypothetical protein
LKEWIESRLLDSNNANLVPSVQMLNRKHWLEDVNSQLTYGENEVRELSLRLQLNERYRIGRFPD